jgi:hypothetical protein
VTVARLRLAPVGETMFPPAYGLDVEAWSRALAVTHTPLHMLIGQGQ